MMSNQCPDCGKEVREEAEHHEHYLVCECGYEVLVWSWRWEVVE